MDWVFLFSERAGDVQIVWYKPAIIASQPQELSHCLFGLGSWAGLNHCSFINLGLYINQIYQFWGWKGHFLQDTGIMDHLPISKMSNKNELNNDEIKFVNLRHWISIKCIIILIRQTWAPRPLGWTALCDSWSACISGMDWNSFRTNFLCSCSWAPHHTAGLGILRRFRLPIFSHDI